MVVIEATRCPECDARVRNDAFRCPRCRHRLRRRRIDPVEAGLVGAIVLLVGIGTVGMFTGTKDSKDATKGGSSAVAVLAPRKGAAAPVKLKAPAIPDKEVLNRDKVTPIANAIRSHWTMRAKGDDASLRTAYSYYTGEMEGAGEAKWIADVKTDGALKIRIYRIWVENLRADHASTVLKIRTASTGTGCRNRLIRYDMVRVAAGWRMNASRAKVTQCFAK